MGRSLTIRYKEHIRSTKYNREEMALATHTLNNRHQYGRMENIMDVTEHARKGKFS
jgi:hypothetical protein